MGPSYIQRLCGESTQPSKPRLWHNIHTKVSATSEPRSFEGYGKLFLVAPMLSPLTNGKTKRVENLPNLTCSNRRQAWIFFVKAPPRYRHHSCLILRPVEPQPLTRAAFKEETEGSRPKSARPAFPTGAHVCVSCRRTRPRCLVSTLRRAVSARALAFLAHTTTRPL